MMADNTPQPGSTTIKIKFAFPASYKANEDIALLLAEYHSKTNVLNHSKLKDYYHATLCAGEIDCQFSDIPDGTYRLIVDLPDELAEWRLYCTHGYNELGFIDLESSHADVVEVSFEFRPPYTHVQFVPYYIHTGDRIGIDGNDTDLASIILQREKEMHDYACQPVYDPLNPILNSVISTIINKAKDQMEDLELRCQIMIDAVRTAYEAIESNSENDPNPHILKVLMAPEFFFQGAEGGYEFPWILQIINKVKIELDRPRYANWLFILGTFEGYLVEKPNMETNALPTVNIFNTAIAYKGGPDIPHKVDIWSGDKINYLVKERVAFVDLQRVKCTNDTTAWGIKIGGTTCELHTPTNVNDNFDEAVDCIDNSQPGFDLLSTHFAQIGEEWCRTGVQGGSLFRIDNITFAVEICVDHSYARVKTYYESSDKPLNAGAREPLPQIHLIPSAGTAIDPDACVGDIVINVDCQHCELKEKSETGYVTLEAKQLIPVSTTVDTFANIFNTQTKIRRPFGLNPDSAIPLECGETIVDPHKHVCSNQGYIVMYAPLKVAEQRYVALDESK